MARLRLGRQEPRLSQVLAGDEQIPIAQLAAERPVAADTPRRDEHPQGCLVQAREEGRLTKRQPPRELLRRGRIQHIGSNRAQRAHLSLEPIGGPAAGLKDARRVALIGPEIVQLASGRRRYP